MKKAIIIIAALALSLSAGAQQITWSRTQMDGSRTGCTYPGADNVSETLGSTKGRKYTSPKATVYKGGAVAKTAKALLAVQPEMADLKQVVAVCPEGMETRGGNSPLANFATDVMLASAEKIFGQKADIAVLNSGGIRANVPAGNVLKDDMVSVFPFHNKLVLVEYPGQVLIDFLNRQGRRPQPYAGAKIHVTDGVIDAMTVGGKEIDPNGTYYRVTIDFLLGTGDNMRLAAGSTDIKTSDLDVIDVMLDYLAVEKAAGRTISAQVDDRYVQVGEMPRGPFPAKDRRQ